MNIFFLHLDTQKCAEYHCDKHVVKMIVETAQLLSTAHHVIDYIPDNINKYPFTSYLRMKLTKLYKPTHKNHPCAVWVRENVTNYMWTWSLLDCLCKEYTRRYGKIHKTSELIPVLMQPPLFISNGHMTMPAQAMPDQYKNVDNPISAYRNYYIEEKKKFAKWTNRSVPEWFNVDRWPSG